VSAVVRYMPMLRYMPMVRFTDRFMLPKPLRRGPFARTPAATSAHPTQRNGWRFDTGGTRQSVHHTSPQSLHCATARSA
jgi:hypothetical protein